MNDIYKEIKQLYEEAFNAKQNILKKTSDGLLNKNIDLSKINKKIDYLNKKLSCYKAALTLIAFNTLSKHQKKKIRKAYNITSSHLTFLR